MNFFEKCLRFVQALIDNTNSFIEPMLNEIQRYSIIYPDAAQLVAFLVFVVIFAVFGITVIFIHSER